MNYRVKFSVEVPKGPKATSESIDFEFEGTLPFIPARKMMLVVFAGDDFREVDQVFWDSQEPERLEVFFKSSDMNSPKLMRQLGWKEVK